MEPNGASAFWEWLRKEYPLYPVKRIVGMDSISEIRLNEVHPILAQKIRIMADALIQQEPSIIIRVTQGMRTWDEQQALYDKGRITPGPIVTEARPGYSYHQYGLAVDVVPLMPLGPNWNVTDPVWQKIVAAGLDQGLVSGSAWKTFKDWPHFQLTGALPVSPTAEIRALYNTEGIVAVWKAAGLPIEA